MKLAVSELKEIIRLHQLWLNNDPQGKMADLRWTDLRWADLRGTNLRWADLRGTDFGRGPAISR